jgi:integrase
LRIKTDLTKRARGGPGKVQIAGRLRAETVMTVKWIAARLGNCIDFTENKITFPSPKGGEDRAFSVPMPSALRPLFERIRKAKQKFAVEFPFQPSRRWQQFFIKIKKPHLCFHCLRVSYVNRLRRAGVPREAAMRLVNHSSELIHSIYQRERVEDVAQWRYAVRFPA